MVRSTQDADIVAEMRPEHLQPFVSALADEFYVDEEMGGEVSDRQWRDILGVLKVRAGELELDYLRKWANELKVSDLLERALKEAE